MRVFYELMTYGMKGSTPFTDSLLCLGPLQNLAFHVTTPLLPRRWVLYHYAKIQIHRLSPHEVGFGTQKQLCVVMWAQKSLFASEDCFQSTKAD